MRNKGIEIKDWPIHRQQVSLRLFIADLLKDFDKFVSETVITWSTMPLDRTPELTTVVQETIDDYRSSALYSTLVDKDAALRRKEKKQRREKEIMDKVANMSGDIADLGE